MDIFIWRWVTVVLTVYTIASTLPSSYANPLAAGKNSTSKVNQTKADCLANQYYDIINQVCENCTVCPPGTQHSSQETCGKGEGVNTTCETCPENQYQPHDGFSKLKCRSCVTCDQNADILQDCNATQNADCGPCHAGYYEFSPNWCLECIYDPGHQDCKQTTIPTTTPSNLPSPPPITQHPSLKTAEPPSSSSLPSGFTEGNSTFTELIVTGSHTNKASPLGVILVTIVVVILICVGVILILQWRKRTVGSGTSNTDQNNASYKPVSTISKDQPSTSSGAEAEIVCEPARRISRQSSQELDREQLLGTGPQVPLPSFPSSAVTNEYPSMPKTLSIHGGNVEHGIGMYPRLDQGQFGRREPDSPDSAKVNFSFQGDDDQNDSTAEPMVLRS